MKNQIRDHGQKGPLENVCDLNWDYIERFSLCYLGSLKRFSYLISVTIIWLLGRISDNNRALNNDISLLKYKVSGYKLKFVENKREQILKIVSFEEGT